MLISARPTVTALATAFRKEREKARGRVEREWIYALGALYYNLIKGQK